jgi:hypothetical protein
MWTVELPFKWLQASLWQQLMGSSEFQELFLVD